MYQLIGEAKELIENQLDRHVEKLRSKHPEFYPQYWNARRVIYTGARHEKKEEEKEPAQPVN